MAHHSEFKHHKEEGKDETKENSKKAQLEHEKVDVGTASHREIVGTDEKEGREGAGTAAGEVRELHQAN